MSHDALKVALQFACQERQLCSSHDRRGSFRVTLNVSMCKHNIISLNFTVAQKIAAVIIVN